MERADLNNEHMGGGIDFWSSGWTEILLVDYDSGMELINAFLEPEEKQQISDQLDLLVNFLLKNNQRNEALFLIR